MQLAAHSPFQRLVDKLVLLHPVLASERGGNDPRGIMVAVARQIAYLDLGIRHGLADQPLDFIRRHRHVVGGLGVVGHSMYRGELGCARWGV